MQYSEHDWKVNSDFQYNHADGDCSRSEAVVAESNRLCDETKNRTDKHKIQVERKFDLRISDVDFWRAEIDKNITNLKDAITKLQRLRTRIEKAAESCKDPMLGCRKAMCFRDKRLSVDMVQDRPQREIQKYIVLLDEVMEMFDNTIEQIDDQIISNRAVRHSLLRDVSDKQAALEIDISASGSRPQNSASSDFKFDPNLLETERKALTLAEWERLTRHNIEKSLQHIKFSTDFGPRVEEMLEQSFFDMLKQHKNVVEALNDRLMELLEALRKLEERMSRIEEQILNMEKTLQKLDQSIAKKEPALELAAKRMEERRLRPRNELCRDLVDLELEKEVRQLNLSIKQLRDKAREAKEMLRSLEQTKLSLQKDIDVKKNSVHIDQKECLNIFESMAHIKH